MAKKFNGQNLIVLFLLRNLTILTGPINNFYQSWPLDLCLPLAKLLVNHTVFPYFDMQLFGPVTFRSLKLSLI